MGGIVQGGDFRGGIVLEPLSSAACSQLQNSIISVPVARDLFLSSLTLHTASVSQSHYATVSLPKIWTRFLQTCARFSTCFVKRAVLHTTSRKQTVTCKCNSLNYVKMLINFRGFNLFNLFTEKSNVSRVRHGARLKHLDQN